MQCLNHINYESMNSGNTMTAMTLAMNPIIGKCLTKMANDVTTQVRDKLVDIIIAVLAREFDDFDGETVRRLIFAELESTPMTFELEKHVAVSKTPTKTKVVELDADGNAVKKVRPPKEHKEKAPKAVKPLLSEEEREARKAEKEAAKAATKEARKAEKESAKAATKDADKEAAKEAHKAEKAATNAAVKAEKEAAKEAAKLAKPTKEQRIPIPWCGVRIPNRCEALRAYHGLFAQCTSDSTEISAFCPSCEKTGAQFGTCAMRLACGVFDYTEPKGKKCVRLANVVNKFEVEDGIDAFIAEAAKHDITIPAEHLTKEVKIRGRPKSMSPRATTTATKIATSDSGSETETDDEEYQTKKKQQQQQQRKKVTKTAAAAATEADAAPKKRGRPTKAKEAAPTPNDSLIQDLVASALFAAEQELVAETITPISSPAAAVVAPAAPKKAAIKPKTAPKVARKVIELDGDKFWEESFEGIDLYVRCSDNIAFDRSTGNGVGTWNDKTKTLIEDNDSETEE